MPGKLAPTRAAARKLSPRVRHLLESPTYLQADEDASFLQRPEMCGVRLQLDYWKTEESLKELLYRRELEQWRQRLQGRAHGVAERDLRRVVAADDRLHGCEPASGGGYLAVWRLVGFLRRRIMPAPPASASDHRSGPTRFSFHYRGARHDPRLYEVLIVLDDKAPMCRIEIRHASPIVDDLPPLSSGQLSAARLRKVVGLLGLIERMTRHDRSANVPGSLVSIAHLQNRRRPRRQQVMPKRSKVRGRREVWPAVQVKPMRQAHERTAGMPAHAEPLALALSRTSARLARPRRRYPVRRP
ncbi:hypothetical protein [Paraburkholderia sp. MM5384-R2]|uniref:hypothetical protein n=1 Tax=Paraburkholderia sp. MM5384-R2 TaxID=2723097 RepID=UPI0039065882